MIQINKTPGAKILELGGGNNPHPASDFNVDVRAGDKVNLVANLDEPIPLPDAEWNAVYSQFVIEHLSWRKVFGFVKEIYRLLKPEGSVAIITANTPAQIDWINKNPQGWDGKNSFESFSCVLFGDQDYPENAHKNYMSPELINLLFTAVGFTDIQVAPFGERQTDMVLTAKKPAVQVVLAPVEQIETAMPVVPAEELFDSDYFDGGNKYGGYKDGYRDFPFNQVYANFILNNITTTPEEIVECGAGRGYILKRVRDSLKVKKAFGYDISSHCEATACCSNVFKANVVNINYTPIVANKVLLYSVNLLQHMPYNDLDTLFQKLPKDVNVEGLHIITCGEDWDGKDQTFFIREDITWWRNKFDQYGLFNHKVYSSKEVLQTPQAPFQTNLLKLNLGSHTTMYGNGWVNVDINPLQDFAKANGYNFLQHDLNNTLPFPTGSVDAISLCHTLEHFSYDKGISLLRECRRVLKPSSGVMRIQVPDFGVLLADGYMQTVDDFESTDTYNRNCKEAKTLARKTYEVFLANHSAVYDDETLKDCLDKASLKMISSYFDDLTFSHDDWKNLFKHKCINISDKQRDMINVVSQEALDTVNDITLYAWAYVG